MCFQVLTLYVCIYLVVCIHVCVIFLLVNMDNTSSNLPLDVYDESELPIVLKKRSKPKVLDDCYFFLKKKQEYYC